MKKIIFLFSMMFTIMLAMSSCSAEETELSETIAVNQINSLTIKKLQEYNEVMMAQKPHTRAINGKGRIACADVFGAIRGMNVDSKLVKRQMDIINSSISNGQFDVDKYIRANPIGNEKVENVIKEYFKLFTTYPENVDDLVKITNDYIEIIESGNEFTEDEKAMIYAGLMVSIYSPQIWNGFE